MDNALEFDGIEKSYKGFTLHPATFDLPRGYMMGLIGPNGAGKTTLIKLALDLVRGTGGAIRIFGMDHARDGKQIRSRVAYVPDEPRFHEDIKLEHLKQATAPFYPGWDEKRFVALVDAFDLPLDRKFKKLSAGMKTKFALALALSQGAELLLLDEPTSGLDPAFRRDLLKLLGELLQDDRITVLFSTHLTADLERTADYITFVRDGHVVFSKPKDVVLDTWVLVKGGPELIRDDAGSGFIGIRRGPHGFEAITDDAAAVRARFGDSVVVERPSLEDIVLLTTSSGDLDA